MPAVTTAEELKEAKSSNQVRIRLKIGDESNVEELIEVLTSFDTTSELSSVDVVACYENDFPNEESEEICNLIAAIGGLESVVHVSFENLGSDDHEVPFPLDFLTAGMIQASGRLESLVFDRCSMAGTEEDTTEFTEFIENLVCLRCLEIVNNFCIFVEDEPINLDDLLSAISKLPLIESVELLTYSWEEPGYPTQFASSHPIRQLISSQNLKELTVGNFHLKNEGLKDILQALHSNTNLRKLVIHFASTEETSSLKALKLLTKAMLANTTLEVLKLEFDECCPNIDSFLMNMAEALAKNTVSALHKFKVTAPVYYGAKVEQAFLKTLRDSNFTLKKLDFDTALPDDDEDEGFIVVGLLGSRRSEMDLYLRLNGRGRKYIMNNIAYVTREKWVDTYATLSNDLDGLFHYLRMNPIMCQVSRTATPENDNSGPTTVNSPSKEPNVASMTAEYQGVMEKFQQQLTTCLTETNDEIQRLNRKHSVEKTWLEEEVLRLREENAVLKSRITHCSS